MRRTFAAALALLSTIGTAAAQDSSSYETLTRAQVEQMDAVIVRECAQQDRALRWLGLEEDAYHLRGDRELRDAGTRIFTERYEATGCGAPPRHLNFQIFHGGAQALEPRGMLLPPGATAVNAGVMVDLFRIHIPQLMAIRHPGCRSAPPGQPIFIVTNTTHVSGEPFAADDALWVERWDYRACGEDGAVDISFSSNGERVRMAMSIASAPSP